MQRHARPPVRQPLARRRRGRRPRDGRRADALLESLGAAGIGARAYYRTPVHLQPAMRELIPAVELPGTEEAARTNLAVPMSPLLGPAEAEEVVAAMRVPALA